MPGPLDGIRVLDFTIAQQGPYATLLLADMGAEVIKIEARERGEVGRLLGIDRRTGFSAYFLAINVGMRSKGVFWSIVIAEGFIAAVSIILFRRGRWKRQKI